MKSFQYIYILGLSLLIFGQSCKKTSIRNVMTSEVDKEFVSYFQDFAKEAKTRGYLDFEKSSIGAIFHDDEFDEPQLAKTIQTEDYPTTILINKQMWDRLSPLEKEYCIFHELGHAFLGRPHFNDKDLHGICVSLMASSNSNCIKNYNGKTRQKYLNELFNF